MKKKSTILLTIGSALLALTLIAAVPASTVLALSEEEPQINPQETREFFIYRFFYGLLARSYRYQKSMVSFLETQIEQADDVAANAQVRINELRREGKDVSSLEGD